MIDRYMKQQLFLGNDGQEKIQHASVLVIGAGALGSSIAEMLVRAGIGELTIVDRDYVEWSNLQRQQLYSEEDAKNKLPKAIAAKNRLLELNSSININSFITDINAKNIDEFVKEKTILIDATDNFETRMIVNDAAIKFGVPFIFGACVASYGITFPIIPGKTPCLNCVLEHIPSLQDTCDTVGVISPIVQIITAFQVTSALKLITGTEVIPLLQSYDVWKNEKADINIEKLKHKNCPTCGDLPIFPYLQSDPEMKTDILCGRDAIQLRNMSSLSLSLEELSKRLINDVNDLIVNPYLLSCSFEDYRIVLFKDGRAIIHGTNQPSQAKSIYKKIVNFQ
ncbi:ThiF family adenylyltransferase [Gottfriedia solisilvae]|uniref:Sulfur carrier protein ThiS adenylyltransferase n=1 Tax=Gottfriedia solisilvae TaxID=1516104 RepID=A0A8J3F3J6_9BACI|nr:ThiF family adenylyltransferase [Gottfriedia solisilvae]GGI15711.1 sulfur carrier protein ThiS adenylyltransferase [Gottfriedia solisilvae]